jgi:hypothetical protein
VTNLRTEHEIEIDRIHDRQLAEKDAEIERLKGESAIKESAIRDLCAIARDKNALISELCDALETANPGWPDHYRSLLQRAREATK